MAVNAIFLLGIIFILLFVLIICLKLRRSNNAIVIIEPRNHPYLETVINNFNSQMDSSWDLYVFHGKSNRDYAVNAVRNIYKRRVFPISLGTDNLTADEYNSLLKKSSFWDLVKAENILVFQTDVALCANSKLNIYDFINYDYIGCSINDKTYGNHHVPKWWEGDNFYGIGGLSFRKKSFMMKCIADNPSVSDRYAEDVFFSNCVAKTENKPANASVIADFCTQNKFTNKSFGAHKTSLLKRDSMEKYNNFATYCPEIKIIDQ